MNSFCFKSFYERYLGNILIASLAFFLIVSVIQKAANYFDFASDIQLIISFIKLCFLIFFIVILIVNFRRVNVLLIYLSFFLIVYLLANFHLFLESFANFYSSVTGGNFFHFNKYLYPFIFVGVFSLTINKKEVINVFFGLVEKVLIINTLFIIVGLLFSIDYFHSYPKSFRFGFSGLLDRMFLINFSIIIISRWVFMKKINWKFWIIFLGTLLSGTKLVFLFFTILAIFYFYTKGKTKLLLFVSSILLLGLVYLKEFILFMTKLFPFWQPIFNKHGYLTLIFSNRDLNWQRVFQYLKVEGTFKNLLVGGVEFPKFLVEMDFIDLFLFFGIIGGTLYTLLLSKIINKGYHLIPILSTFFAGGFLLGTISMCTYLLWCYESNLDCNKLFTSPSKTY